MNESTFDLSSMQSKPIVSRIKKTLTIVVVCDVLGQENNGTTIAAMHLIRALRNKGHHVRVVCSDIFRVGEQDYYIVPQLNLGPINKYVKKTELYRPRLINGYWMQRWTVPIWSTS